MWSLRSRVQALPKGCPCAMVHRLAEQELTLADISHGNMPWDRIMARF